MLFQAGSILVLTAFFSLASACGGGSKSSSEEPESATEEAAPTSTPAPLPTAAPTPTAKPASTTPISKGDATDVNVSTGDASLPSLTLFNVDNNKLSWNEGAAGTTYTIYRRPKDGPYESNAFQTLSDMASFSLPEAPGNWCYKVRAALPNNKGSVDSNEVCITGPALLLVGDQPALSLAATQAFTLTWTATGGSEAAHFSCIEACPTGLAISDAGALNWTPTLAQMGSHSPKFRIKSGSQILEKTLSFLVNEAPLQFAGTNPATVVATHALQYPLAADAHGLPIQYSCVQACPQGLSVDANTGLVSWTPTFNQAGSFAVTFQAKTAAQALTQILNITVTEAPLQFTAPLAQTLNADETLNMTLQAAASGAAVTYACVSNCPNGLSVNANTGVVLWSPTFAQTGSFAVTFSAQALTQTQQQTLNITVLEAPLVLTTPLAQQLKTNETLSLQLQAVAHGAPIAYACLQNCPQGLNVDAQSGAVTWTPQTSQLGTYLVTFSAQALTQTQQKTLQITVNEAALSFTAPAAGFVVATQHFQTLLQANSGGHSIQYSCSANCPTGLTVDANSGEVDWTPAYNRAGTYAITFQAKTAAQTQTQILNLTVTEAPLQFATPAAQQVKVHDTLSLTLNADASGAPITYACDADCPQGFNVDANTGVVTWTPTVAQLGSLSVTVSAHALTQTLQKILAITVNEADLVFTAPALGSVVATHAFQQSLQAAAGGHGVQYSCLSACPTGLTVDAGTGVVSWTPAYDQAGSYAVTFQARTAAQTQTQILNLTVTEAPLTFPPPNAVAIKANANLSQQLVADAQGAPITFSCVTNCPQGLTVSASGLVSWTPTHTQLGNYSVTFSAHALSQTVEQTLSIAVNEAPLNFSAPAAASVVATNALHTTLAAEAGGHTAQYACLSSCPSGLSVDAQTGAVDWTPTYDQAGTYNVVLRAQTAAQTANQTLTITVTEYPLQWTVPTAQRVTANQALSLTLQADAHGAPITFACASACPQGLSVSAAGQLSWTPQYFQAGSFTVTLSAHALTQTINQTLSIVVDEAPLHFTAPATARVVATENILVNLQAEAGGQTLQFSCTASCPSGLTVNSSTGQVSWTPTAQQVADFTPVFTVQAGTQSAQQTLTIQVVQAFINLSVNSNSTLLGEHTIAFTAQPSSNLSGTPTYSVQQTAGSAVTLQRSGTTWSFTAPNVRQPTNFSFAVTATIGSTTRTEDITLAILPNDHAPLFTAFAAQTIVASEAFSLQAVASDADGDAITYSCILDCPSGFAINASSGLITWTPAVNQTGTFTPSLQVEANGRTVTQTLSVLVQTPTMNVTSNSISGISGNTVTITVSVQSNLRGPFQYSISQASGPVVTLAGSAGSWSFTVPALNFPANVSFDVIVGNGLYSTLKNFTGRLDPQPIAPTVDVGPDLIKNQSFPVTAVASPNSQTLAWSQVSGPGTLTFSNPAAATTNITATAEGTYVVRLTATNSWGQTGSDDLTLVWDTTPPTVNAGADVNTNVALTRTATVSGAQTLAWSKTSGPGLLTFTAISSATTTIDSTVEGDYVVRLTATDAAGNSAYSEFKLSLDKTPPTMDLGPAIVTNLATVPLSANVSNDADTLNWTKVSGPGTVTFADPDTDDTTATFSADGVYTLRLTATDAFTNTRSMDLSVTIDRTAPVIGSIALGSTVADGYLNVAEHAASNPLISAPTTTDLTAVTLGYKLTTQATNCTSALTYTAAIPATNDTAFTSKGTFKVCVQAKDAFNQASYTSSPNIIYETGTVTVVISSLPPSISSSSSLTATAGGTGVTHYAFKVGAASATTCSDSSGYSTEQDVSLPLTKDLSSLPDGSVRLCAIGRNISGNWQPTSTAYAYTWTLDRAAPDQPQNLVITGLTQRVKFNWTKDPTAAGYIVVRSTDVVTWQPTAGVAYTAGQAIDSNLTVVSAGLTLPAFDNTPVAGTSYQYAVFGYDSAYNYSPAAQGSAAAQASIPYNIADGFDRTVRIIVPAKDGSGKYYAAGDFLVYGSQLAYRLIRFNADMSVDTTFVPPAFNNVIYAVTPASDGKVYVGGTFTASTGVTHVRLIRLNSDGSVDSTFNVGTTGFNSTIQTMALDESLNRLYVGGAFTTYKGAAAVRLVALKTDDGSVDTSFNCGTCVSSPSSATINAMNVITGQGIYLGGSFTVINGTTLNRIARLNAAGAVDTSFTTSTGTIGFDSTVYGIERDSNGFLYVVGAFGKYRGSSNAYRFTRLTSTGAIDTAWPVTNKFNGTIYTVKIDPEGSIYVGGDFTAFGTTTVNRLAHVSPTGVLDSTFPAAGGVMNGLATGAGFPVLSLTCTSTAVLAVGAFQKYGTDNVSYFVRTNRTGSVLTGTPRGTMANAGVYALAKTATAGEYLMGGYFTTFKGTQAYRIAKVNKNGVQDTSLANVITTSGAYVYALAWDSATNKFYAGGSFTAPSGRLARFNSDGTADTSFNTAISTSGFSSDVLAVAYDPTTGGVYVGGKFPNLKTTAMSATTVVNYLVRLLPNGNIDTTFNTGTGFNAQVNALQVMDDGTLLVGGSFTSYNGTAVNRLIRLNGDGSPNNSFDIGTGFNGAIQAVTWVKSEHAIYVAGAFTTFRGVSFNRLAKLDEAGGSASGWSISTGLSGTAYALSWDSDQDILWVGGNFSTVRGVSSPRIAGINRDGTLHTTFAPGTVSLNGDIRALQADAWGLMFGTTASTYQNKVMDFVGRFLFNGSLL